MGDCQAFYNLWNAKPILCFQNLGGLQIITLEMTLDSWWWINLVFSHIKCFIESYFWNWTIIFSNFHSIAAGSILSLPKLVLCYLHFLFLVTKYIFTIKFIKIFCTVKPCQRWYFYFSINLFLLIFLAQSSESCAQESERALLTHFKFTVPQIYSSFYVLT